MKIFLILYLNMILPFFALAQPDAGVQWTTGLSWDQVKEKAKKENKYIFIDAFATWCGPCKRMDKEVFPSETVGTYMNDKFIAVKVQMDKTKKDADVVKQWYPVATAMSKDYRVIAFPTYVFLSPEGRIVHKVQGFQPANKFIEQAAIAVQPGQVYVDKYSDFDELVSLYDNGNKDYSRMLYMIRCAEELNKKELALNLKRDYRQYLEGAAEKELYRKENLQFLEQVSVKSSSRIFALLKKDQRKIDRVYGNKGFAKRLIDNTIFREITLPFLKIKPTRVLLEGDKDSTEADWSELQARIKEKYPVEFVQRGIILAKCEWYEQKYNFPAFYDAYLDKLNLYGIDTSNRQSSVYYAMVNHHLWWLFLRIQDQQMLNRAIPHAKWIAEHYSGIPDFTDTYANLLYKSGRTKDAIVWEKKALEAAEKKGKQDRIKLHQDYLTRMLAGEPTWPQKAK